MSAGLRYRYAWCLLLIVAGCGGGSPESPPVEPPQTPAPTPPTTTARFEVTGTNLTSGQSLSRLAVVAHGPGYEMFTIGEPATLGLESLAEGGGTADLLGEADAESSVLATASGDLPFDPGASSTLSFTIETLDTDLRLSLATMLENTNDGFAGVRDIVIGDMDAGAIRKIYAVAYDAGTEADTETADTVPGPAVGGGGFNPTRDDQADRVSMHAGVISDDAGLPTSALDAEHRFDNPVLLVAIVRLE
ncbi:MAG: spondin domain-containing protein [Pseudomonadota bacterium]